MTQKSGERITPLAALSIVPHLRHGRTRVPASGRAAYLANPNHCLHCRAAIPLLPSQRPYQVKQKKFCNSSCAASFSNVVSKKRTPKVRLCAACQNPINQNSPTRKKLCISCGQAHQERLLNRPKHLCTYKDINNNARDVMRGEPKVCLICGYAKHADVCHIRAISSFPGEATCGEINQRSNLVYLCPNHHWEFDHGNLAHEEIEKKREEQSAFERNGRGDRIRTCDPKAPSFVR